MLKKHLIAKVRPKANKENEIYFLDYRVQVLTPRLFRIEKGNTFLDEATTFCWFRDMDKNSFTVNVGKKLVVKTTMVELHLSSKIENSFILIDGKKVKLNNDKNLLGTYRTLDRCDGGYNIDDKCDIKLGNGVISQTGVAVIDDSNSCYLMDNGEFAKREQECLDLYVFAYGKDYKQAIKDYFLISGSTPALPRYVLGNWWSRYYVYTDKSYLQLLDKFKSYNIPLTVATIDMDWHYSSTLDEDFLISESGKNTDFYGGNDGWTGYSWNKKLFPDYKKFLKDIKERNLKITLNVHPALGIRWWEDDYKDFATAMGKDYTLGEQIKFDMTDPNFVNNYFKIIHNRLEKDGVDFWWIDWQQGTSTNVEGLDPLFLLNHYHYLDSAKNSTSPVILSRFCGAGAHRYPLGFSGDTLITWDTLKYLPYFTHTASNIGYGWWSHDIGGHFRGEKCDELYLRSVQMGVFMPILRLHCCNDEMMSKEPWNYKNGIGELTANALRYRHSLIPFIYTMAKNCHIGGDLLIEPMYYYHAEEKLAYEYKDQYYFGGLIVAPVVTKSENGLAKTKVWLPKGKWTNIFTLDQYEGDRELEVYSTLDNIPVFAKAGQIVTRSLDLGNSIENPTNLVAEIYSGNGEFTLYEDKNKKELYTTFTCQEKGEILSVTISCKGSYKLVAPKDRCVKLSFKNINCEQASVTCYFNGSKILAKVIQDECLHVILENFDGSGKYLINVESKLEDDLTKAKNRAYRIISCMQGENEVRNSLYNNIKNAESYEEFKKAVLKSKIYKEYKEHILNF